MCLIGLLSCIGGLACSPDQPPNTAQAAPGASGEAQQLIVERAAHAVATLRGQERFAAIEPLLRDARALVIFPGLLKASLVVGGEGGNGVVVVRDSDGSWSDPAFYSIGAPSVGLQVGVRRTTVMLFVMNDRTVDRMLYSSLTLGATTSATLGRVGERDLTQAEMISKDVYELAEAGGVFAGFSLDGYVIAARQRHNHAYYGPGATPRAILKERRFRRAEAGILRDALAPPVP